MTNAAGRRESGGSHLNQWKQTGATTLGRKMVLGQGAVTVCLALVAAAGVAAITTLLGTVDQVTKIDGRKVELTSRIDADVSYMTAQLRGMLLSAMTGDMGRVDAYARQIAGRQEKMDSAVAEIEPLLATERGKQVHAAIARDNGEWKRLAPQLARYLREQKFDEANKLQAETLRPLMEKLESESLELRGMAQQLMSKASAEAESTAMWARLTLLALSITAVVIAVISLRVLTSGNRMLRLISAEIAEGARQVASASRQVSSASQALAQGSSEQAATLEETSASTEEINSMTQKNAESARTAASETEKADKLLSETTVKLEQMIESMKEINTSSEKISRIIRVIDEIAFQTNILALNAAVEAARAGEAGMGFAVVADEVRNLAQRCAQAAKDTSDLIEESIVRSQEGKTRLDEVSAWVTRVVENAARIRTIANEVNTGSQEQARGIEQIARAVAQMQNVTQATAASAEESASAGEEMSAQAEHLNAAVGRLEELVGSESAQPVLVAAEPARRPPVREHLNPARRSLHEAFPLDGEFKDF